MTEPVLDAPANAPHAPASARTQAALIARPDLVVCNECDAVHERVALKRGTVARCRRCYALIGRGHVMRLQTFLAFALASLLLIVVGNSAPIVTLDLRGVLNQATLPEAIRATWDAGQPLVALLTAATALVFPLCFTVLRLYLLLSLTRGVVPPGFVPAMRLLDFVTRWSMVEVFMMGTLVAVVRSASLTSATPGIGLFAYAALTLLLTSLTAGGTHSMWKRSSDLGPSR
ncbi:MAG: paraquat-inducible protein A [Cytophagales bacterium]|nr:paraquat-inducible protein A [Rhizobacter sp.]